MSDEERHLFQQIIASFDTPAYMRRARDVEAAWNEILLRCQLQYEDLLEIPKLRLAQLHTLLQGQIETLCTLTGYAVTTCHTQQLQDLFLEWQPKLQSRPAGNQQPLSTDNSRPKQMIAARQLSQSFQRFNFRWNNYVAGIDLTEVNRLRSNYNEYYLLEKECVVHSANIARIGYEPLNMATMADITKRWPMLPNLPQF